ncbi:MAG: beta-propeller domain-containing protein, partial [Arenimonas sp.]
MFFRTLSVALLFAAFSSAAYAAVPAPKKTMKAFASEQAFLAYIEKIKQAEIRRAKEAPLPPPPPPAPAASADAAYAGSSAPVAEKKLSADANKADDGITNVQTQGVDEGDIVKKRGDYLIILRRGRLFTVKVAENNLQTVSTANAYAPDVDPNGTWYDEMLISGNTVVVIGYSYQRGGTEVGLFNLNDRGVLKYQATYHLR